MEIYVLDMGQTKYGDSILITHGNRRLLIDGGHPGDSESIENQLASILQTDAPFDLDLLVVTHCHSDHIGCLPNLVKNDIIRPTKALVADEKFGWGRGANGDGPADSLQSVQQKALFYALQEEDHSDLEDEELDQFIQDAGTLEDNYIDMLNRLENAGIPVIRYGRDKHKSLEAEFDDFGLKILGPTLDHLLICAEALSAGGDALGLDTISGISDNTDADLLVKTYRSVVAKNMADDAQDRPGTGAQKNNQSIVIKVAADGWAALLAADMQLAKAEVPDLPPHMLKLRKAIVNAGSYDFIKLTHHTSYNGLDENVLADFGDTELFAHTGGRRDAGHPDEGVLDLLRDNKDRIQFARTDRNGLITVKKQGGRVVMIPEKGRLNNFSVNSVGDEKEEQGKEMLTPQQPKPVVVQRRNELEQVEVIAKVPEGTRVTITIEVSSNGEQKKNFENAVEGQQNAAGGPNRRQAKPAALPDKKNVLGGGRRMPKLLFVTCSSLLQRNVGQLEVEKILGTLRKSPDVDVLDLPAGLNSALQAAPRVRQKLSTGRYEGVVVLGGYDVVPSYPLDVLDASLRQKIKRTGKDGLDADGFIVWSDDLYGDSDGDLLPELPVSRIPDGRRADVLLAALQAPGIQIAASFGIRNYARPFADLTFSNVPGGPRQMEVSERFGPANIQPNTAQGAVYFMLHGSDKDGTKFWGETADGDEYEAIAVDNIPQSAPGTVVFTGCCWGALPVYQPAIRARANNGVVPKPPEESIAISYLLSGALAFIGCTGSHYSPLKEPYNYYGKPIHDAFWRNIDRQLSPASALFEAKKEYAINIPHGPRDSYSQAIELKILRQYTCLGLGW